MLGVKYRPDIIAELRKKRFSVMSVFLAKQMRYDGEGVLSQLGLCKRSFAADFKRLLVARPKKDTLIR